MSPRPAPTMYPTPTSLEDRPSPKHIISIPLTVLPTGTGPCLPLLGRITRKTAQLAVQRKRRRRGIETEEMRRVRGQEEHCSFGPRFNSDLDGEAVIEMQNFFEGASQTERVERMLLRMEEPSSFRNVQVSRSTKSELETSLATVFYPVCAKYNASIDTAFLAYGILARYCRMIIPRIAPVRSQLYVAVLMVAFKYNEEEDPNIADFSKTILKSKHCPPLFSPPTAASVLKMEQKVMKVIEWRISDIVTPIILTYSLLDCFPNWDLHARRQLAKKTEIFLDGYLATGSPRHPCFSIPRWTVFALSHVLAISGTCRNVAQIASTFWNVLYPGEWRQTAPSWYDDLMESCTMRFEKK